MEAKNDMESGEASASKLTCSPSEFSEKLQLNSPVNAEEIIKCEGPSGEQELNGLPSTRASQTLWSTGELAEPIPDGFYFFAPERRFKEFFDTIPSLDELYALQSEGLRPNVIVVDTNKDKKLLMLKQLTVTLGKGLSSSPAALIKKIAGLVCDFYKPPNPESNYIKGALEEVSHALGDHGIHTLGQIKHGSCYSRAILFKVLADTAGLESRLMVGLPREGVMERTDSYKYLSVIVVLNSTEHLVDLMCAPGKLIPCSTKSLCLPQINAVGEVESAENDSYNSPFGASSPLYGFSDQADIDGSECDDSLQSPYQRNLEASANVSASSLRNMMLRSRAMNNEKLNSSQSEPNVANSLWRRAQKKVIAEHRTASPSPEHPYFRGHGRSILGGHRYSFREYSNDVTASRSADASPIETHRRRRRCISMVPEIGDDIVRAVRAMNETMKRNHLPGERGNVTESCSPREKGYSSDLRENVSICTDGQDVTYGEKSIPYISHGKHISSHKAYSMPSSPQYFTTSASTGYGARESYETPTLNKVMESSKILSKTLFPFEEWNIDFSEITIGTRVGIGFFGEVFCGSWNGTEVAIKVFLEQDLTVENIEDFCNEISILSRVRHPNVILFLGACTKPPQLSMVTEYMEMGSLYYLIHVSGQKKRLSWRRRLKMLCDICRGLMCIHRMKIAHRDLKSANCLVNKDWTVKICDFGLSRVMTTTPMRDSSSAGTPEWMAPELIRSEPFTEKCDIFSLGVIIWELCTLRKPWEGVPSVQVVHAVANDGHRLQIPEGPLGKIVEDCWAEPEKRPTCQEILASLLEYKSTLH